MATPLEVAKAECVMRGKLLLKLRQKIISIDLEDEGDRVYLASTNDAETFKSIQSEIDDYGWDEFIKEKNEPDIYERCRKANAEVSSLKQRVEELERILQPFVEISNTKGGTPESDGVKELCVVMMDHVGSGNGLDIVGKFATACLAARRALSPRGET